MPENPSPHTESSTSATQAKGRAGQPHVNGASHTPQPTATTTASSSNKPHLTTKSHLSRELQQYYARLTESLLPPETAQESTNAIDRQTERKRSAALSSLRSDAGLQGILPYLVKWVGDSVMSALTIRTPADAMEDTGDDVDRKTLEIMLLVINAILDNKRLFVEPYVSAILMIFCADLCLIMSLFQLHMLLPPLLSILLTSTLSERSSYSAEPSDPPTPRTLRAHAASLISHLLELHAPSYPSLPPRITKTLLVALLEQSSPLPSSASGASPTQPNGTTFRTRNSTPPEHTNPDLMPLGSKDGAIRGLTGVGKEAVYRGLIGGKAGRTIGEVVERRILKKAAGDMGGDDTLVDLNGFGALGGLVSEETWDEEIRDLVDAFMVSEAESISIQMIELPLLRSVSPLSTLCQKPSQQTPPSLLSSRTRATWIPAKCRRRRSSSRVRSDPSSLISPARGTESGQSDSRTPYWRESLCSKPRGTWLQAMRVTVHAAGLLPMASRLFQTVIGWTTAWQ